MEDKEPTDNTPADITPKKPRKQKPKLREVGLDKGQRFKSPGQYTLQITQQTKFNGEKLPALSERYDDEFMKEAIYKCYGLRTQLCFALDCSYNQLTAWLNSHKWAKDDMVKAREGIVNLAEEVIIKALQSDDEKIRVEAAKTTLRQLGRNYGWGEAGSNVMAVSVQQDPDNKKVQVQAIFGMGDGESNGQQC